MSLLYGYSKKTPYGQMTAEYKEVLGRWAVYLGSVLVASFDTREEAVNYIESQDDRAARQLDKAECEQAEAYREDSE